MFCNGSVVIFTCETRGSATIEWRGDNFYVGNLIGFSAEIDPINHTINSSSNQNTVATLTENYLDGSDLVLVSTLRIITTSDAPNGTVKCIHADDGTTESIVFEVLSIGKYRIY